ncbi:MAG: glycosyltransferase family 9 protein [bacterium]|nr:glycosyltransferase family 9 protein [bacterium]
MMGQARSDFRRILLIRRKALGDALVSLPAVAAIAEAWPKAAIDLVIDRPLAGLLGALAPGVHVISYPDGAEGPWLRWLRARRYELVVDWLGSPRTAVWTALSGARLRVGYDLPGRRWAYNLRVPRHRSRDHGVRCFAGEAFLDPVRALGLDPSPWRQGPAANAVPAPPAGGPFGPWLEDWLATGSGPRVVLVMSATWPAKAWPARHVAALWLSLTAAGARVVLAPGPGDEELVAAVRRELPPSAVAPPSSLAEMATLLRASDLMVGTDNGLRHLAVLLGLPTVTVFGPTDPHGWNPPGARHVSVSRGEPCSPCDLKACPVPGHPCLESLPAEAVAAAVLPLIGLAGRREDGKVPAC